MEYFEHEHSIIPHMRQLQQDVLIKGWALKDCWIRQSCPSAPQGHDQRSWMSKTIIFIPTKYRAMWEKHNLGSKIRIIFKYYFFYLFL